MNGRTHGLCSLLTLIRLAAAAARKHTHTHTHTVALIVSWRSCFIAFANANCHFRLDSIRSCWRWHSLIFADTNTYCARRAQADNMNKWTNTWTPMFALCTAVRSNCTCNLHACHFLLFNRLNYILWSRKHRFQREITAAAAGKNQCNCLTFNCNRLLYAIHHAMAW